MLAGAVCISFLLLCKTERFGKREEKACFFDTAATGWDSLSHVADFDVCFTETQSPLVLKTATRCRTAPRFFVSLCLRPFALSQFFLLYSLPVLEVKGKEASQSHQCDLIWASSAGRPSDSAGQRMLLFSTRFNLPQPGAVPRL